MSNVYRPLQGHVIWLCSVHRDAKVYCWLLTVGHHSKQTGKKKAAVQCYSTEFEANKFGADLTSFSDNIICPTANKIFFVRRLDAACYWCLLLCLPAASTQLFVAVIHLFDVHIRDANHT